MNDNKIQFEEWSDIDCDAVDFDELERRLNSQLEEQMLDVKGLELDSKKIGSPDSLGETVKNVIWEQFINQIGVVAGEDFIKENRELKLDLRNSAHIQTTENFAKGKIATHNDKINYQRRYNEWQDKFARDANGNIKMKSARITNAPTEVLNNDARGYIDDGRPTGSASMHMDHTVPAAEIIRDRAANAHLSKKEQAEFANSDINLNSLDSSANQSKSDSKMTDWLEYERYGQKPAERFNINEKELRQKDKKAREKYDKLKKEGEERSIKTGKQSKKNEAKRIGGKALRSVVMGLFASLMKEIIRKLVIWFRSANRKFSTFISSVKDAIKSFISNIKEHLLNATDILVTTIATAIFGPVIGMLKKAWIFLRQGYKSVKEAISFLKDPANKNMPFNLKMMNVGKIVIVGLTAGGSIVLSEIIEKTLLKIPGFAFEIPLLGSLANIIGIFLGALVSGLIGAIALNLIDKAISKKLKSINLCQQIEKKGDIIKTQERLINLADEKVKKIQSDTIVNISQRHIKAGELMNSALNEIIDNSKKIKHLQSENIEVIMDDSERVSNNNDALDDLFNNLKLLK